MNMFRKRLLIVFLLGLGTTLGGICFGTLDMYAEAGEEGLLDGSPLEISADVAVYDKYMWRGFKLDGDAVMQPGVNISAYGFTGTIWGSFDFDADDSLNSDEVDYVLDYTYEFGKFSLSAGNTYYDFPASDSASKEWYIGGSVDTYLSPSLTWFHDYGEEDSGGGDGDYILLGLSHSFDLSEELGLTEQFVTLDLAGSVGYNDGLFIIGEGGDINLSAGLGLKLTDKCSISPVIAYSIPFGDLEDSDDGNQDDEFYGGVSLSMSM